MVFSTPIFLFYYLVAVLFFYYIMPTKWRNAFLFAASLFFYYWGEQKYTIIMLLSTVIDYTHGLLVARCKDRGHERGAKMAVASSVCLNLGILFFFKYWDFAAVSLRAVGLGLMPELGIVLPIGISFYTFQTMSYTIDIYRGEAQVQKNILSFGSYVTLFPQLIAGPIVRYKDVDDQLRSRDHSVEKFSSGIKRFLIGLCKKLLLANNVGLLWESYKSMPVSELSVLGAWLGAVAFAFQIYFDFSGYSDMAVGLGRMLGFEFMENFRYPYIAKSITDFWRRWHISLSTWFREYLYIPLGGNRCSAAKVFRNLLIVWAATGIWHGASWNYLMWGIYFWALLMLEKVFLKNILDQHPIVGHIYTMVMVCISWVIFALEDLGRMVDYFRVLFGCGGVPFWNSTASYYLHSNLFLLVAAAIASTPLAVKFYRRLPQRALPAVEIALVLLAVILCTAYLVAGTYNPFLYFRF